MRKFPIIAVALALALALPGSAFAAASTSSRTESLLVIPTITLTGLPATTLTWTASPRGSTLTDAVSTIVVASDAPLGYTVNTTHDVLTATAPAGTIAISAQKMKVSTTVVATDMVITPAYANVFGTVSGAGSLVALTCGPLCTATTAGTQTYSFTEQIVIPVGTVPALYTGTLVYAALTL